MLSQTRAYSVKEYNLPVAFKFTSYVAKTNLAMLFRIQGKFVWLPISRTDVDWKHKTLQIPGRVAAQNGLVGRYKPRKLTFSMIK